MGNRLGNRFASCANIGLALLRFVWFDDGLLRSDSHKFATVGALTYTSSLSEHEDAIPHRAATPVVVISDTFGII
jgi:hypothetical protein